MDYVLRKLDELQEALYDLEDFLENNRENEVLEFVSDHWKECLMGGVITFFALYQGRSFITVSTWILGLKIEAIFRNAKKNFDKYFFNFTCDV